MVAVQGADEPWQHKKYDLQANRGGPLTEVFVRKRGDAWGPLGDGVASRPYGRTECFAWWRWGEEPLTVLVVLLLPRGIIRTWLERRALAWGFGTCGC
ncbi:hypothetical protein NDU88_001147 [Pleurodeles waltl]|uniref:Uncharacterized protein n=1 Tax=Pleurodeles waltl TaxID=8319 RepID=A0AAV7WMQ6_PLEWA|nr:hypothetical protein NDU88_001147 [Pleurodeles waltl]